MKKAATSLGVARAVLTWCAAVAPAGAYGRDPPGEPVRQHPSWPEGLADVLTRGGRVYSPYFGCVAGEQYCFYFSGDADDFNWGQWARLKGVPRVLGLHPGRERATNIMTKQPVGWFDWKATVTAHWSESGRNPDIRLELWVGGEVELARLKVSPGMTPTASGSGQEFREIERFIAQ